MKSSTSFNVFRAIAWFASIYHIILGLVALFGSSEMVISLAEKVYGITITIDHDLFITFARFAATYMIAFGLMMGLVARRPYEYRNFAWVGIALFLLRIFDRVVFSSVINSVLNSTLQSSMPSLIIVGLM